MAKTERIQNMTKGSPAKLIFTFAIPLMLGNVFQQFYTVVDTAIVGQALGVNALAALGAADWLNWLVLGLIQGFAQGFSIYMAQRFGAEDHEGLNRSIGATISLSAVISILTVILSQVAMAPVLRAMNTPEEIIGGAFTYLRIMFAGIPIIMAYNVLASTLYAMMMGIPANMMRRYVNAPPMISSGVFMARSTGAMATWLRMTVKIEMTAESEIVAPMERLRPSWSSAPKRCAM